MVSKRCSDAGKELAACRWGKHKKNKGVAQYEAEKAARKKKKKKKVAKVKQMQAALKPKSMLPKGKIPKKKKKKAPTVLYNVFDAS